MARITTAFSRGIGLDDEVRIQLPTVFTKAVTMVSSELCRYISGLWCAGPVGLPVWDSASNILLVSRWRGSKALWEITLYNVTWSETLWSGWGE